MPEYVPECYWTFNCSPGPDDYDFFCTWENVIVQRNNLQYVRVSLHHWNEIDGWKFATRTYIPPNAPTSEPFTLTAIL